MIFRFKVMVAVMVVMLVAMMINNIAQGTLGGIGAHHDCHPTTAHAICISDSDVHVACTPTHATVTIRNPESL